jgi:4-diphosphocytidyl-2-C-methyl-D-erythritol kinase
MPITLKSNAKINIALRVLNRRNDGFHNIETIFTNVSLCDKIKMRTLSKGEIVIKCSDPSIPADSSNIAYKAAEMVKSKFGIKKGIEIIIEKKIPAGAGLAGGSSNGATVVRGCLKLWSIKASPGSIYAILKKLGSDVPYCYLGGTALGKGRGEILKKVPPFTGFHVLIVNPGIHVSTPVAYRLLKRELTPTEKKVNLSDRYRRYLKKSLLLCDLLENDFEDVVFKKYPLIQKIKRDILKLGADGALMSGSGSTVFGLFAGVAELRYADCFFSEKGYKVFKAKLC